MPLIQRDKNRIPKVNTGGLDIKTLYLQKGRAYEK